MKTLNLQQMEVVEGGTKPCTEEQAMYILGAATALTIFTGGFGAWAGAAALYTCVLKAN